MVWPAARSAGPGHRLLDDPELAIAEAHRVLRPGGLLAFSGPPTGHVRSKDKEPDQQQPDRWDFYGELMRDMAERPSATKKPDPFTPPPRPLPQICAEAGFTGIEQRGARATFAIRDPMRKALVPSASPN